MAIKQRKQLTGTTAQINAYAGVEGQLVWDKTKKKWVGMSGTAGTNYPMASESHTHSISNVTNLQSTLDGKQPKGDYATSKALTDGLAGKANKAHTHAIADVTNLQTTLNAIQGKIPTKTSQLSNDSGFLVTHPTISVAAKTLDSGSAATVTKSGTDAAPVFTFGIPKGADGAKGDRGDPGPQGPQGPAGSSAPTPKAYVTSAWRSGEQWYRRWSDGWLEQGGRLKFEFAAGGDNPYRSFSLPTAFSNDTYTIVATGAGGYGDSILKVTSQTTSSVTVFDTRASGGDVLYYVLYVHFYCSGY